MPVFTIPIHESNDCHNPAGSPAGGQFCSTGTGPSAYVEELLAGWTDGTYDWGDMQHAARAVIDGLPVEDYVCYDCRGDDRQRYYDARLLLTTINNTEPLTVPLYRGLIASPDLFPVGAEFSESLTSWTARSDIAERFAKGEFSRSVAGSNVVLVFESTGSKGLKITSRRTDDPLLQAAEEYLTTGKYRVTGRTQRGGVWYVTVARVGPAESVTIPRVDSQGRPYSTRVQPVK